MDWKIEVTPRARADIALIFQHLFRSHQRDFGHSTRSTKEMASSRIDRMLEQAMRLERAPYMGTAHDEMRPGLRHVTLDRAIFWFVPDEAQRIVQLVSIFHGGQDHMQRMLGRLQKDGGAG